MRYRGVIVDDATQEVVDTSEWKDSQAEAREWLTDQLAGFGPRCGLNAAIQRSTQNEHLIFVIDEKGFILDVESKAGLPLRRLRNEKGQVIGVQGHDKMKFTWTYDETTDRCDDMTRDVVIDPEVIK